MQHNHLGAKKRALALALAAFLALLTSCGTGDGASASVSPTAATAATAAVQNAADAPAETANMTAPGELPIVNEPVTLTIGMESNASVKDWATNEQTVYIEEVTGVNLEFIDLPKDEFVTKIDLMIAAGGQDLPDILMGTMQLDSLVKWGQTGLIRPLNDYYEQYGSFVNASFEEGCNMSLEEALVYMTAYDGNIYSLPSFSESYNNELSGNRLLVYEPWLEQLGIDRYDIVTTEDYYNMLVKIRDSDPNGNGEKDEIPLISCKNYLGNIRRGLMSPFVTCQSQYWTKEDGKVDVVFDRDEWREGIRYVRKLVEEGLLMPESFTQDEQQMTAIQTQETHVVGGVGRASTSNIPADQPTNPQYYHILPLEGPTGLREIIRTPSVPGNVMAITANCENPEIAFRLGDYLSSEEMTIWGRFGVKGEDWFEPKEGEMSAYEEQGLVDYKTVLTYKPRTWADVSNIYWANSGPRIYGVKLFFGQAQTPDVAEEVRRNTLAGAKDYFLAGALVNDDKIVNGLVYNEEESEIINSIYKPVVTFVEESWARFVLGDLDINNDSDWNAYLDELASMEIDLAIGAAQSCVDRMFGA